LSRLNGPAFVFGVLLLLPGACSLYFLRDGVDAFPTLIYGDRYREDFGSLVATIWLSGVVLGAAGLGLLFLAAIRGR
jgi:hypothetical protein